MQVSGQGGVAFGPMSLQPAHPVRNQSQELVGEDVGIEPAGERQCSQIGGIILLKAEAGMLWFLRFCHAWSGERQGFWGGETGPGPSLLSCGLGAGHISSGPISSANDR